MAWTIENITKESGALDMAELGFARPTREQGSMVIDTCRFRAAGVAAMGADVAGFPIDHGDRIEIKSGETPFFYGRANLNPRHGSRDEEAVEYEIQGPWAWFEELVFAQPWTVFDSYDTETGEATFTTFPITRAILFQSDAFAKRTTGDELSAVAAKALAGGAPFQVGSIIAGFPPRFEEVVDSSLAEVFRRIMRYHPSAVAYFDYSTSPPTLNVKNDATLSVVEFDVNDGETPEDFDIVRRDDLVRPGVTVLYEKTKEIDGKVLFDAPALDTAGSGNYLTPGHVVATVKLAGARVTNHSQKIETETWPEDNKEEAVETIRWYKARVPDLAAIPTEDLKVFYNLTTFAEDAEWPAEDVPRELRAGQVSEWMEDAAGELIKTQPAHAEAAIWYVGNDPKIKAQFAGSFKEYGYDFIATNAVTKTYKGLDSFEDGEPTPGGVAAALYAELSKLHYDGTFSTVGVEFSDVGGMGSVLNFTNDRTEWATAKALVQSVSVDAEAGRTVRKFGFPGHLSFGDIIDNYRMQRDAQATYRLKDRENGTAEGGEITVRGGEVQPVRNGASSSKNLPRRFGFRVKPDGDGPDPGFLLDVEPGTVWETGGDSEVELSITNRPIVSGEKVWVLISLATNDPAVPFREMEAATLDSGSAYVEPEADELLRKLGEITISSGVVTIDREWESDIAFCIPTSGEPGDGGGGGSSSALSSSSTSASDKPAVVAVWDEEAKATRFINWSCSERPIPVFEDCFRLRARYGAATVEIPWEFVGSVRPATMVVESVHVPGATPRLASGRIVVENGKWLLKVIADDRAFCGNIMATVAGVRKGFRQRWRERSEAGYRRNREFWGTLNNDREGEP